MTRSGPRHTRGLILVGLAAMLLSSPSPRIDARDPLDDPRRHPAESLGLEDDADAQAEMEFMTLRDPRADVVPRGIRRDEMSFAQRLPDSRALAVQAGAAASSIVWTERGPNNVGGRTRVFAVDAANPATLIAGS